MVARKIVGEDVSPFTGEATTYEWSGEWWEYECTLPPLERADAAAWQAFLLNMRGKAKTCLLGDPNAATMRGTPGGTPLVDGGSQTGRELDVKGLGTNQTNAFRAGDYIQLGSGSGAELYMVTADANADGSGLATLDIWPALRTSPSDSGSITTSSPRGVFRLATNQAGWSIDSAQVYGFSLVFREAI